jgi:threonyl-tRNA synthetase
LGAKIRRAEMDRIPFMAVVGPRDLAKGTIAVRSRIHPTMRNDYQPVELADVLAKIIAERRLPDAFSGQ